MYLDKQNKVVKGKSLNGPLSAGVPGLVAGLLTIHKKFGKLPLKDVLGPSIEIAEKGFKVYPHLAKAIKARSKTLSRFPSSKKIFYRFGRPLHRVGK